MLTRQNGFPPLETSASDDRSRRIWTKLSVWWAVYYTAILTVGRIEEWTQPVIWIGAPIVLAVTARSLASRLATMPSETARLGLFVAWVLLGGFVMTDSAAYWYYFRMILELVVVVAVLGAVVRNGGSLMPMWWAFIVVAVFNTIAVLVTGDVYLPGGIRDMQRQEGLAGNSNALGFFCFLGILGAMAVVGEIRRKATRAVCATGAFISFVGMILSGSRGAYLVFVLAITLWPVMCYSHGRRNAWKTAGATLAVCAVLYGVVQWIQTATLLGSRSTVEAAQIEEDQRGSRLQLAEAAVRLIGQYPIAGVGVGQFSIASGEGWEAHNEWLELAATTGVPGLLLFVSIYFSVWRRLARAVTGIRDPISSYRANIARLALIVLVVAGARLSAKLHQHRHRVPAGRCRRRFLRCGGGSAKVAIPPRPVGPTSPGGNPRSDAWPARVARTPCRQRRFLSQAVRAFIRRRVQDQMRLRLPQADPPDPARDSRH